MNIYEDTYLAIILHDIAQGALIPVMIAIVALIVFGLFFLGWIIAEYFTERRHFKQNRAAIVNAINDASYDEVVCAIEQSSLLRFQKAALVTVARNMGLPEEPLFSLAQMEISAAEKKYKARLAWTDTVSKIAPLLGLMGTLIPLGPGIVALGSKNTELLSNSLLLAFDATVCGLIAAVLALIISKVRSGWYTQYIEMLESVMGCVVDKAAHARDAGVQLATNYTANPLEEWKEHDKQVRADRKVAGEKDVSAGSAAEEEPASAATQGGAATPALAAESEEASAPESADNKEGEYHAS